MFNALHDFLRNEGFGYSGKVNAITCTSFSKGFGCQTDSAYIPFLYNITQLSIYCPGHFIISVGINAKPVVRVVVAWLN